MDTLEAVCRELLNIWIEAKSTMPDGDNWDNVTWESLPEKHKAEYIMTANRISQLFKRVEKPVE